MAIKQFWKCWHLNWILRTLNDNLWKVWVLFGILKHWQWHNFIIYFLIAAIKVFWSLNYSFSLTLSILELLLSLNLSSWCHYKCLICLLNHPGMCCNRVCWGRIIPSIGRWWFSSRGTGLWWVFFPLVVSVESDGNFFFCTLPGLGMIHVGSTITDLASFSIYVSEYKKFHFPSHVMICLYAHNTWGTHNIYLNDDISSCSDLQYQTQINCPKTETTLKVAAKHLSK